MFNLTHLENLVKLAKSTFPDSLPTSIDDIDIRVIAFNAGRANVVRWLQDQLEKLQRQAEKEVSNAHVLSGPIQR